MNPFTRIEYLCPSKNQSCQANLSRHTSHNLTPLCRSSHAAGSGSHMKHHPCTGGQGSRRWHHWSGGFGSRRVIPWMWGSGFRRWHHWSGDLGPDDGIPAPPAPGHTRNTIPAPPDLDPGECFPGPGDLRQENVRDRRPRGFTGCHHWSGGSGSRRWHPCTAGSRSHTKHHPCTAGSGTRRVLPWTGGSPAGERAKLAASWIHRLSSPVPPYTRVLIRLVQKSTWRSLPDSCWRWIRAGGCHLLCSASL